MMNVAEKFLRPADHLSQGDIFKYQVVAPLGDHEVRIVRTLDGRHGSCIFESGEPFNIFNIEDLESTLAAQPEDPLRTKPFQLTYDKQKEMVVVYAGLLEYFMIASQTCDIAGVDSEPNELSAIVPLRTLFNFCRDEVLDSDIEGIHITGTIIGIIKEKTGEDLAICDELSFSIKLRELLDMWNPAKKTDDHKIRGKIRGFLNNILQERNEIYYIESSPEFSIPEGFADFTQITTVPTKTLEDLKSSRVAKLGNAYSAEFAQRIGSFIARIATPTPMKGEKF